MSFKFAVIRFFRSYFPPISPPTAELWYNRFRMLYLFTAFNIGGYGLYVYFRKDPKEAYKVDEPYLHKMIRMLEFEECTVYNIGTSGVRDEYKLSLDELKKAHDEKRKAVYEKFSV